MHIKSFSGNLITQRTTPTNTQTMTNIKESTTTKGDSFTSKSKQKDLKKKAGFIAALGALAVGVGVALISRGKEKKALQEAFKQTCDEIPETLLPAFKRLQGEEGEAFVQKAYQELVEHLGLKEIAPKAVRIAGNDGVMTVTGGYNLLDNTISYSKGMLEKLNKPQQFTLLAHELKHCEQYSKINRTEGLGFEALADATTEMIIKNSKNDFGNINFIMKYNQAEKAGKLDEFLTLVKQNTYDKVLGDIQKGHSETIKLPKIAKGSQEALDAQKYLDATSQYEGLNFMGFGSDEYKNNLLEVEAYSFGDKLGALFAKYSNLAAKLKK